MKRMLILCTIFILYLLNGCSKDTVSPVIEGIEDIKLNYEIGSPTPNWLEGITARDNVDGDLTSFIKVDTNINMNEEGHYHLAYMVKDQSNNVTFKFLTVNVIDLIGPIITGFRDLTIDVNSTEKPDWFKNVTAIDTYDGDITDQITVDDSEVLYSIPGDYPVYYQVSDRNDNSIQVPITLSVLEVGTRTNPVDLGDSFNVYGDNQLYGDYKLQITVNDIKRGQEALSLVADDYTSDDLEYLITNITIKLLEIDEVNSYYQQNGFSNWDDFIVIPNRGHIYDTNTTASVSIDLNTCRLYLGDSCTGNLLRIVNKEDLFILKYNHHWFNLTDEEDIYVSPNQIIGYSIDVINSDYADDKDIKFDAPILDETMLANLTFHRMNLFQTSSQFHSSTEGILERNPTLKHSHLIFFDEDFFITNKLTQFPPWIEAESKQYEKEFYYSFDVIYKRYILYIPDYLVFDYNNYFDANFIQSLNKLDHREMSYENFFKQYGTHLIASGVFGARAEVTCAVLGNEYEEIQSSVCSEITKGTLKEVSPSYYKLDSNIKTFLSIKAEGGIDYTFTGIEDYEKNQSVWLETINQDENLILVDFGQHGLIPLWEILPPTYEHMKDEMESKFIDYYNHYKRVIN